MFDATFWIFFTIFFVAWIGCIPLLYFVANKIMNRKEDDDTVEAM